MIREFRLDGWRVQPQFHQLVGPDGAVEVEARSMEVLVALARQAEAVVSRRDLLEEVWGESIVEEAALTHAVWDLRRGLGDDPKDPRYIQTLPKRGYRLIAKVAWLDRGVGETERYRLLERIGGGGMGVVFRAEDTRLRREVALKFLPPEWSRDSLAKERFLREARVAAALDHPNLCNLHEIDETEDGRLFLVMALYQGETLRERLARGPLEPAEAVEIALLVARGLAALHGSEIVHRDIKPGNIMLPTVGQARILDFGLAKFAGGTQLTTTGASPGTPTYMSPEQLGGSADVDSRTDIWSLGAVLYEMLAGRPPFRSDDATALVISIVEKEPPALEIDGREAEELTAVVGRSLAKRREDRYPTAAEMLQGLLACGLASAGDIQALPRGAEQPTKAQRSERPRRRERPLARSPALRQALVVAVALVVAGIALTVALTRVSRGLVPSGETEEVLAGPRSSLEVRRLMEQGHHFQQRGDTRENLAAAEQSYRKSLGLEAENHLVKAELAALLARTQSQFASRERAEEIEELASQALGVDQGLAPAWFARGRLRLLGGDAAAARDAADRAVEADPQDYRGYTLMGQSLLDLDRVDEGLGWLRRGVEVGAGFIWARLSLARALEDIGRSDEATAEYRKVLAYRRDSPAALNNLASVYVLTGRDRDAVPLLLRLLELEPVEARAWSTLGFAYFNLDRMTEALDAFETAHELSPTDPDYMRNLGDSYEKLGDVASAREWFRKALVAYDRALAAGAERSFTLALRAVCKAKLGDFTSAERDIEGALEIAASHSYILFCAAQVHALAGHREQAYELTRRILAMGFSREELGRDACFRDYRDDPEFQALLDSY